MTNLQKQRDQAIHLLNGGDLTKEEVIKSGLGEGVLIEQRYRRNKLSDLIEAYDSYIDLLGKEINDLVGFAASHGWRSSRYEAGCECRENIEKQKKIIKGRI